MLNKEEKEEEEKNWINKIINNTLQYFLYEYDRSLAPSHLFIRLNKLFNHWSYIFTTY